MYGTGLVSVVSGPAVPSSHLKSGDALELHHLQHLLGLSINLDDVLEEDKMYYNVCQYREGNCQQASKHFHHIEV